MRFEFLRPAMFKQNAAVDGDRTPRFFRSRREFRAWLEKHHAGADVLWVGFWKAHTGKRGLLVGGKPVEVATGSGGEFYFENATPGDYPAEVDIDGHACRFTLSIPAGEDPVVNVPDVQTCDIP